MTSKWIKVIAVLGIFSYSVYFIYLLSTIESLKKAYYMIFEDMDSATIVTIIVCVIVLGSAYFLMLFGAIYRIGTLTDRVNVLEDYMYKKDGILDKTSSYSEKVEELVDFYHHELESIENDREE